MPPTPMFDTEPSSFCLATATDLVISMFFDQSRMLPCELLSAADFVANSTAAMSFTLMLSSRSPRELECPPQPPSAQTGVDTPRARATAVASTVFFILPPEKVETPSPCRVARHAQ